jgi:hypothetical protein
MTLYHTYDDFSLFGLLHNLSPSTGNPVLHVRFFDRKHLPTTINTAGGAHAAILQYDTMHSKCYP